MEREILQKISICGDMGFFSLVLDGSPVKTLVSKKRNHQIPASRVSQQVWPAAGCLAVEVGSCYVHPPYLPSTLFQFKAVFSHNREFLE